MNPRRNAAVDAATVEAWERRIRRARRGVACAQAIEERTIRDAHDVGELAAGQIVAAYGSSSRARVYKIVQADARPAKEPAVPIVVYLHGDGAARATHYRVAQAMWARGWQTVDTNVLAWHLDRGGMFVFLVEFSCREGQENAPFVYVTAVRAKGEVPGELQMRDSIDQVMRPRPLTQDPDAPDQVPGTGGYVLDVDALAAMVEDAYDRDLGL